MEGSGDVIMMEPLGWWWRGSADRAKSIFISRTGFYHFNFFVLYRGQGGFNSNGHTLRHVGFGGGWRLRQEHLSGARRSDRGHAAEIII